MKSGIYKLVFSSGNYYIGKSVDIPRRLEQHAKSLRTGKAAERMQQEYYRCGSNLPQAYIVAEVHPDHIDVAEAYYIARGEREYMLNTNFMDDPFAGYDVTPESLQHSTLTLLLEIKRLQSLVAELKGEPDPHLAKQTEADREEQWRQDLLRRVRERRAIREAEDAERRKNSWWYRLFH